MVEPGDDDDGLWETTQKATFTYFLKETTSANGLVADKTRSDWMASIAATGLALASYPVAVERRGDLFRS